MVNKNLCERMKDLLPFGEVRNVYGCTEIGGVGSCSFPDVKYGSTGKVYRNTEMKVIDESNENLGPLEQGEILIKISIPFLVGLQLNLYLRVVSFIIFLQIQGYYNNLEQTKEALDEEGWLHTGDIGYFDEKENLYIVDRKKDILKYQGYHVSPSELEEIINTLDSVVNSCVVGVFDNTGNDIIYAFVQRKSTNLTEKEVLEHVNGIKSILLN